jgi:NAD(P)H-hydrate epimerase
VLAVDVPSGLDVDSGLPASECIKADVTATFVATKPGFLTPGARPFLGRLEVIDIGVPRRLLTALGLGKE